MKVRPYRDRRLPKTNLCGCGCGGLTAYTYVHGHHTRLFSKEEQARRGRCNNGDAQRDRGAGVYYRKVGGRHEHRTVAEEKLGRPLLPGEIVHHRNGVKRDNHPDNLEVTTQGAHIEEHRPAMIEARKRKHGW